MATYEFAPEVEVMANSTIEAYHHHLKEAHISYVFRDKAWKIGRAHV